MGGAPRLGQIFQVGFNLPVGSLQEGRDMGHNFTEEGGGSTLHKGKEDYFAKARGGGVLTSYHLPTIDKGSTDA